MLETERYIRAASKKDAKIYREFCERLLEIEEIICDTPRDNEFHDLQLEIIGEMAQYYRKYALNIALMIPHFTRWYGQVIQKYKELTQQQIIN